MSNTDHDNHCVHPILKLGWSVLYVLGLLKTRNLSFRWRFTSMAFWWCLLYSEVSVLRASYVAAPKLGAEQFSLCVAASHMPGNICQNILCLAPWEPHKWLFISIMSEWSLCQVLNKGINIVTCCHCSSWGIGLGTYLSEAWRQPWWPSCLFGILIQHWIKRIAAPGLYIAFTCQRAWVDISQSTLQSLVGTAPFIVLSCT